MHPLCSHIQHVTVLRKLARDVNNELAEAQREVLQLRDENLALQEETGKYKGKEDVSFTPMSFANQYEVMLFCLGTR